MQPDLLCVILTALFGLAVTVLAIPLTRKVACQWGMLAVPGGRRNHHAPTPLLGGLAIFVPFTIVFLTFFLLFLWGEIQFSRPSANQMLSLFLACSWIMFLGTLDDKIRLDWKKKVTGQLFAIAILVIGGHRIDVASIPLWATVDFGWLGIPIFVLAILLIVNAINIIDGVDGLAAGISLFAALTCAIICFWKGDIFSSVIAASISGSLLGFLFFNFPPASIYLGDGGSLFLGLLLGTLAASSSAAYPGQRPSTLAMVLIPFLPLSAAFLDVVLAIVRRWISGRRIFAPDADHLHHRLLEKFKAPKKVIAIFYGFSVLLCVLTLGMFLQPESQLARTTWGLLGLVLVGVTASILKMYRVGDFKKTIENRPHFQFVSSYRAFMAAKMRTIDTIEELLALLATGVTDLGYDSVEILRDDNTVCYWVTRSKRHPKSPRLYQELTFQEIDLTVKWIVPNHESKSYQKFLEIIWYQVVRDLAERVRTIEQIPYQLGIEFSSVDSSEDTTGIQRHSH